MKLFKYLASLLFGFALRIRHFLFDTGLKSSVSFDVPIICIGNLKVGGTGKTPMTDFLVSNLKNNYKIAVLSRGYKRKTKGFVLANESSTSKELGDESMLIHQRHPDITVAVCEKRVVGVEKLLALNPSINLIILDDAYQHRYIDTKVDVLLTEFNSPFYEDNLLPYGTLRDLKKQAARATVFVVTKTPPNAKPVDLKTMMMRINPLPYQSLFFTTMTEGKIFPLFDRGYEESIKGVMKGSNIVIMTGIANPTYMIEAIEKKYNVIKSFHFKDHKDYSQKDIESVTAYARENNAHIVMTEKDATKVISLRIPSEEKFRFQVAPITIDFVDNTNSNNKQNFIDSIDKRIKSTHGKYFIKHKQFNG